MSKSKEVAPGAEDAGMLADLGLDLETIAQDAKNDGELQLEDIAIPYIYILQSNSPQVNPDSDKYIDGATAGMYYLTVEDKVFDGRKEGIDLIFAYYDKCINEWIPRDDGGGLVAVHPRDSDVMERARPDDKGRPMLPNGHQLVETANHYCLIKVGDRWVQCLFPMKSTALKVSRQFNSRIKTTNIPGTTQRAPRYLYTYKFMTKKEQKDDQIWSGPTFEQGPMVSREQYQAAKDFAEVASKGILRMSAADSAEDEPRATSAQGDEGPF